MKYRQLGAAGVRVSEIGLGSYLTIGMSIDEDTGRATFDKARDLGINFIDTADAYNHGEAERALAPMLKDVSRQDIVLATKAWAPMSDNPNDQGLSAKHLLEGCCNSLTRLGVDYIDLFQCHRPDSSVPLAETVRVMDDLRRQGKILYWGTSEWPAWKIAQANAIADANGWAPAVSNQPRYNLYYRHPEMELWPYCAANGIGNVVFSGLAHGVLTGKYKPGQQPAAGTRAADPKQNMVMMSLYWTDEKLAQSQQFAAVAADMGVKPGQLALAWVLRRSEVSSAIVGATKVSQLEENVAAVEISIPEDVLAKLDEIYPPMVETYPG